jgi:site-specific DNA recombinase
MLKNPSYTGKTYVFTTIRGKKKFTKPRAEWIEIPGVTPAIITSELFEAAQKRLKANKEKSLRNVKHEYLLRGHIICRLCGRSYYGVYDSPIQNGKRRIRRNYRCLGRLKMVTPVDRCQNHGWNAAKLESMVWAEIERVLSNPENIIAELEKQRHDANRLGVLETELTQAERQLKAVDHEQHQLLQWALKGFPESQVEAENKRINGARETLQAHKEELETQIKGSQDAVINVPNLAHTVELLRQQLKDPDHATKRAFIESMGIKIFLDGDNVEITGFIPMEEGDIVHVPSSSNS